jgi:hypothetical protein
MVMGRAGHSCASAAMFDIETRRHAEKVTKIDGMICLPACTHFSRYANLQLESDPDQLFSLLPSAE